MSDRRHGDDEYARLVRELTVLDGAPIGAHVTRERVLDFLILYESLAASWSSYPFELHAFVADDEVEATLAGVGIESLRLQRLPGGQRDWTPAALVEHSQLERCLITDVTNVFVGETLEMLVGVDGHDLVFAGAPSPELVGTHLWSFRRTPGAIAFAREWRNGLRPALVKSTELGASVKVLPPPETAKVIDLRRLAGRSGGSAADRVSAMVDLYPGWAGFVPLYAELADRAARRAGIEGLEHPRAYARSRLLDAGLLSQRNHLPVLLNARGLVGTGVEVGVKRGGFSEQILEKWDGERLISVDPWAAAPAGEYEDVANVDQKAHDRFYARTQERLRGFGERSVIWRMTSKEAADRIDPHAVDFVYIDARHDYESVKEDLGLWFDKVRPGGILAGHDYLDEDRPQGVFRVKSAVDEFFAGRGLPVRSTYADGRWPTWFVEIPGPRES